MPPLKLRVSGQNLGLSGRVLLKWRGKEIETWLYGRLMKNLKVATKLYHSEVQKIFKKQPWGSRPVGGFDLRKAFRSSPPRSPPYKQTANLANSIVFSIKSTSKSAFFSGRELRGRTSTEVKYAQNIELGGKAVRIPQTQKIHTLIRLVNPIPKKIAAQLVIVKRPVWIPSLLRLKSKLLKILAK